MYSYSVISQSSTRPGLLITVAEYFILKYEELSIKYCAQYLFQRDTKQQQNPCLSALTAILSSPLNCGVAFINLEL